MRQFRLALPALLALLATGASTGRADAQLVPGIPLTVEARLGVAVPTGDFADAGAGIGAEPGVALAAGAMLDLLPMAAVYAEYRQERFGCGGCAAVELEEDAVSSGAEAGVQLNLPLQAAGLGTWVRGGAVWQALELGGEVASEYGVGYAVGGGVRLGLGPLSLTPGIHLRSYPASYEFETLPTRDVDVTHLVVDLGATVAF